MAILDDTILLSKKFVVSLVIYTIPVSILVGGLWLTKHLLGSDEQKAPVEIQSTSSLTTP